MSAPRTLWSDLRSLDQAIVPRLAAAYQRIRRGARGSSATPPEAGAGAPHTASSRLARLDRLDRRYASRGVLGLVRDVPQVGAAGLAMLLVIASVVAAVRVNRTGGGQGSGADLPTVGGPRIATVGPFPGEDIPSYLSSAQSALTRQQASAPNQPIYSIADFETARTPSETADALPGVAAQLIYVRVSVPGNTQVFPSHLPEFSAYSALTTQLHVSVLPDTGMSTFRKLAAGLDRAAADNTTFANSIHSGASQEDLAQKAAELADARHYRAEAAALRSGCACIYAVVVQGSAQTLLHILDSGLVRAVDPASPGLKLSEITWVPLRPETKARQPRASNSGL